jgi:hypothetical protein
LKITATGGQKGCGAGPFCGIVLVRDFLEGIVLWFPMFLPGWQFSKFSFIS